MKRLLIMPLVVLLVISFVITGCSSTSTTTTTPPATSTTQPTTQPTSTTQPASTTTTQPPTSTTTTTTQPTSTTTKPPTSTTTPTTAGVRGGILTIIYNAGPTALSYVPSMGPQDHSYVFPAAENLVEAITDRSGTGVEPWLCQSVDDNPQALTITWHLRQGVMFSDGTEMTATDVIWNFQVIIDAKALPHGDYLTGMYTPDKYTVVMKLSKWSNQLMPDWGYWPIITSKTAYDKASGGDPVKGKQWLTDNIVATGPFMLKEYKRDDHITWVKNPYYWIKDQPFLDGIEIKIIPDPVTAQNLMQAKQADIWGSAPANAVAPMLTAGFKEQQAWPALSYGMWVNTGNPNSKWQDIRLRQALDYSLDKAALAKAIGFGLYQPLYTLPPRGEWGYDANYNPRPYDPAKAKQLLAAAGYPNGLKINLLTLNDPVTRDIATALKQQLDAGGFVTNLDAADAGRFFGTTEFVEPSADADLMWWLLGGMDANYLSTYFRWFSSTPFTKYSYLGITAEQTAMDKQAETLTSAADQVAFVTKVMRYLEDNALVVPVYLTPAYAMQQPWVHSTEYTQGFTRWDTGLVWMDKH